jgi:colanic acid/amylovoran biosynthesis glycosyltransferase
MTTGYVLDRWVELSQTFVVEEVKELTTQGTGVSVVALHRGSAEPLPGIPFTFLREAPHGRVHRREHLRWASRNPLRYGAFLAAVRRHPTEAAEMAWKRLPWVATQLESQGVDRLHAHFAWAGAATAEALSALTGWPWAMTVHARDIYAPRPGLASKLARCAALITVCDYNVVVLRQKHAVRRDIDLVVCGVTVPEPFTRPAAEHDVVAVGRLVEKKGFDTLIRAFATVRRGNPAARLVIVGKGPERASLEGLVTELDLGDAVQLLGARPHADVLDLVAASKLLCLPARIAADGDADSMPLVVKEAMARAVPVVVTPVGGLPELVDDEVGIVVTPDDPGALAVALEKLLADPTLRDRLGTAGRQRIQDRFTIKGEVAKLREVLAGLA